MPPRETPGDAHVPDHTEHEASGRVAPDEFLSAKKITRLERSLNNALSKFACDFDTWSKRWEDLFPPDSSNGDAPRAPSEMGRLVRKIEKFIRTASGHDVPPGGCSAVRYTESPGSVFENECFVLTFRYAVGVEVVLDVSLDWTMCVAGDAFQGCDVRITPNGEG